MRDMIEKYLMDAFGSAAKTKEGATLLFELERSACERYDEELKKGALPSEAYGKAVGSIGDVDELLKAYGVRKGLLVRFSEPVDGCAYVIYNLSGFCRAVIREGWIDLDTEYVCYSEEWQSLLDEFGLK